MYLGMTAGPRAASAHPIITSRPTCLLEARTKCPVTHLTLFVGLSLPLPPHLNLSLLTEPWALSTRGTGHWARWARRLLCRQRLSPPLFQFPHPLYPPSVFPRPPDAANTGSAQFSPQRSFRSPRTRDSPARLHHENLAGLFSSHPRLSCDRSRGWSPHTLTVLSKPSSVPFRRAPPSHQRTSELDASSSVWNRPSKYLHASFVISGRHGHQVDRDPGPASLLVGTASLYELRSRIEPTSHGQILRPCVPWIR